MVAPFAAVARLPVAAEGRATVELGAVEIDLASAQPRRGPERVGGFAVDAGGEAIRGLVGNLDRLFLITVPRRGVPRSLSPPRAKWQIMLITKHIFLLSGRNRASGNLLSTYLCRRGSIPV